MKKSKSINHQSTHSLFKEEKLVMCWYIPSMLLSTETLKNGIKFLAFESAQPLREVSKHNGEGEWLQLLLRGQDLLK